MTDLSPEQAQYSKPDVEQRPDLFLQYPSNVELDYPQLLLPAPFSALLTNSIPLATSSSTVQMPSHTTESSLGESWASLSTQNNTSEDDLQSVNTDAGSLVDLRGTDDVLSLYDADASSEEGSPESVDGEHLITGIAPSTTTPTASVNVDGQPATSPHLDSIEFKEPEQWPDAEHVDLRHTLTMFDEKETSELGYLLSGEAMPQNLVGTLRMTMSRSPLALDQPFKMLFNGEDLECRAQILRKVADALVSGADFTSDYRRMDFSRYHVVPLEFGPGSSSSQAEMIPIQTQIIVDDCIDGTSADKGQGREQVVLSMKKGEQIYFRPDGIWQNVQECRSWSPPQLAVVLLGRNDSPEARRVAQLMHGCMTKHHIPTLVISEESTWDKLGTTLPIHHQTLHRCVETSVPSSGSHRLLKRLPIDLESFLNLDPGQLNKHIAGWSTICAALDAKNGKPRVSFLPSRTRVRHSPETLDVEKNLSKSIMAQQPSNSLFAQMLAHKDSAVLVLLWVLIIWIGFSLSHVVQWRAESNEPRPTTPTLAMLSPKTSLSSSVLPVGSVSKAQDPPLPSVRGQTDLAQLRSNPIILSLNTSDNFLVEVVGDCHIVVKTPRGVLRKRKEPDIRIRISRGREEVASNTSQLFDGVYAVKIAREDAHGKLNATISTGRASLKQSFELDFGERLAVDSIWKYLTGLSSFDDLSILIQRKLQPLTNLTDFVQITSRKAVLAAAQPSANILRTVRELSFGVGRHAHDLSRELRWSVQNEVAWFKKTWGAEIDQVWRRRSDYLDQAQQTMQAIKGQTAKRLEQVYRAAANQLSTMNLTTKARGAWQDATQSDLLAKAQDRACKIVEDVTSRLKQNRVRMRKIRAEKRTKKGRRSTKMR